MRNAQAETSTATAAERITIALTPKAAAGLANLQDRTGLTKTDLVNRGISLYEFIDEQTAAGAAVLIRHPDGSDCEVRFL